MTLQEFIEYFEKIDDSATSPLGFDMVETYHDRAETDHPCGTACCIGGHAAYLLYKDNPALGEISIENALAKLIDIDVHEATDICWPDEFNFDMCDITHKDAIDMLKYYQLTGIVDWSFIMNEN